MNEAMLVASAVQPRCEFCAHFQAAGSGVGTCHWEPPKLGAEGKWQFPEVRSADFCSRFRNCRTPGAKVHTTMRVTDDQIVAHVEQMLKDQPHALTRNELVRNLGTKGWIYGAIPISATAALKRIAKLERTGRLVTGMLPKEKYSKGQRPVIAVWLGPNADAAPPPTPRDAQDAILIAIRGGDASVRSITNAILKRSAINLSTASVHRILTNMKGEGIVDLKGGKWVVLEGQAEANEADQAAQGLDLE